MLLPPGSITTAMTDKLTASDQKAGIMGRFPAGRMGEAVRNRDPGCRLIWPALNRLCYRNQPCIVNGGMAML